MILEEIEKEDCGEAVYTLAEWLELSAKCGQLELENKRLRAALKDCVSGLRYIRYQHGELSGVGWDRAIGSAEIALGDMTPLTSPQT